MFILRWFFLQPRESLRLANLYMSAAKRRGIEKPSQCIMVLERYFRPMLHSLTLFKREPFTPAEVETILNRIKKQEDFAAIYIPDVFPSDKQKAIETEAFARYADYLKPARLSFSSIIRAESPEKRRAFEKEYVYNIAPVFDDRPFFFEYHKISEIFRASEMKDFFGRGTIVHYVLFLLLGLTGIASLLSMIFPLYVFEREGLNVCGMWSLFTFFSGLGMGFMFIELGFIQRLSIYLGHPMYTLSVVLAGLLLFTGIGSYRAGLKQIGRAKMLKTGMVGVAISSLIWLIVMSFVIPLTLGWPIWIRIPLTLLSIYPVGLYLGIPFATGLRYLEEHYPRFIPWAWGINGISSVLASVLAIILAMRVGFTTVVLLGCVVYFLGLYPILRHLKMEWKI